MSTFLEKLSELLDIDGDEAKKLLDDTDMEELVSLTAAITSGNKQQAMDIMHEIHAQNSYSIGDVVNYNGERATIENPDAPGDTIKIVKGGVPEMVDKNKIEKIDEAMGVMGMTSIPSIDRMKVLAGIQSQGPVGPGQTNDPENPNNTENNGGRIMTNNQVNQQQQNGKQFSDNGKRDGGTDGAKAMRQNQNGQPEEDEMQESAQYVNLNYGEPDAVDICLEALEALEENLSSIKVNELSEVHQRLMGLIDILNENISFSGRKKKS